MMESVIIISAWVMVTLIYTIADIDIPKFILILATINIMLSQIQILNM